MDHTRVISNDIKDMRKTLGVEAARAALIKEFDFAFRSQDLLVNIRHIVLMVDAMCTLVCSISSHGLNASADSIFLSV
jgi:DNA-directed RNA polymerase subunit A"